MLNTQFSSWPDYTQEEIAAVQRVLSSNRANYWTGDEGRCFEEEFAAFAGTRYAIALANGTLALELALRTLGVGPGDEVIVTCRTFIASASAIVAVGGIPVFADVSRDSQNVTAETIRQKLTEKTRAVICVHLAGWPCEMDEILALAKEHDLFVVEDCAQAHGARYQGRSVGSFGHIAAWSFCQDKIMTTGGEGGMVTTDDPHLWEQMWSYKDHGKSWQAVNKKHLSSKFRWLHESFGSNMRLTEMQAAIGRIQLQKMPDWHRQRLQNAQTIWRAAGELKGLRVPALPDHLEHAAYKCYVFVDPEALKKDWDRDRIMEQIYQQGVPCYSGSCSEVYREKAFTEAGFGPAESLPVAEELGETSLMFLVHPNLTDEDIRLTVRVLNEVMQQAAV